MSPSTKLGSNNAVQKNPRTTNLYFTLDRSSMKQKVAHDFACDPSTGQRVFVSYLL